MKRIAGLITAVLIFSLLIISCSPKKTDTPTSLNISNVNEKDGPDILIQSPMTISNNNMASINGQNQSLRLKLVKGKYYEDWSPGPFMGTIWEGSFILELVDEANQTISQTSLDAVYNQPLTFTSMFDIEFDDYNGDGDIDFTLGQYASSNGRDYKLFTLRKNGKIEELPVKGFPSLFISNSTGYHSTKLTKIDETTFKKSYYDNSKGKSYEDIFSWQNNQFVLIRTHEAVNNP